MGPGKASLHVEVHALVNIPPGVTAFLEFKVKDVALRTDPKKQPQGRLPLTVSEELLFFEPLYEIYHETLYINFYVKEGSQDVLRGSISTLISRLSVNNKTDLTFTYEDVVLPGRVAPVQAKVALELQGSARPQLKWLLRRFAAYSERIDRGLDFAAEQARQVEPYVKSRWEMTSPLPLTFVAVAALPLVVVLGVAGAPLLVPLFLFTAVAGTIAAAAFAILFLSSKAGRQRVASTAQPYLDALGHSNAGQQLIYDTGPLPPLWLVMQEFVPQGKWQKLGLSLAIDAVGSSSYLVPVLGEGTDLAWAPIQAMLISGMYGEKNPYAPYMGFLEEILPFTDIIPTATLAWIQESLPEAYEVLRAALIGRPMPEVE